MVFSSLSRPLRAAGITLLMLCSLQTACSGQTLSATDGKELYLPDEVWRVPDGNNYSDPDSEFSYERMRSSDNIAIFWSREFGPTPASNPDSVGRFELDPLLQEAERFYEYYVDELKFVDRGNSVTDKYKILFYVIGGDGGTAFGGGAEQKVGILWAPPSRISRAPFGALAHELGHSFQYLVHANGSWAFRSAPEGSRGRSIFEMTAQYMLWQVYPEWMTFENYHLQSYLQKTHFAFLHETNQYHSPYVLEYWASKHGKTFIGKLWRQALEGEDPVMAYKRLTGITQEEFNDEMFDAARRFMTWDMPRVEEVASPYANQHTTHLDTAGNGWFRIAPDRTPQNYGYNGIRLQVPAPGTALSLEFEGLAGADGYRAIKTEKAGWRYGFVAVKEDGNRVYGDVHDNADGEARFRVPDGTEYLWLVVSGAPTQHWVHITDGEEHNDEQWPYRFRLQGTAPHTAAFVDTGNEEESQPRD